MINLSGDISRIKGDIVFNHPLSRMNTWRTGGNAECLFEPADTEDLTFFLAECRGDLAVTFLGLGSNTLIRDGGINGVVITLRKGLKSIGEINNHTIQVGAGVACGSLARHCMAHNMQGLEFFAGIPGTVGGALRMNAGAFGNATWERVVSVKTIDLQGEVRHQQPDEFNVSYRSVEMPEGLWFVGAEFSLNDMQDTGQAREELTEMLHKRNASQPVNNPSCGSVFKNPPNAYAAKLIEECGLKSYAIGGAKVSEKHANFIINCGDASAKDIEDLICYVQKTVKEKTDIDLQPEVVIVGEADAHS